MKYESEWRRRLNEITSVELRWWSIDYKSWKRRVKRGQDPICSLLHDLSFEMTQVDLLFCRIFDTIYRTIRPKRKKGEEETDTSNFMRPLTSVIPRILFLRSDHEKHRRSFDCFGQMHSISSGVDSLQDLQRFADMNSKTVTKICKRIDKRPELFSTGRVALESTGSTVLPDKYDSKSKKKVAHEWLVNQRNVNRYGFLSGSRRTCLRFLVSTDQNGTGEDEEECPVCLDKLYRGDIIVTSCGHPVCRECMMHQLGIQGKKGRLYNLITWAVRQDSAAKACPICRCHMAYIFGVREMWSNVHFLSLEIWRSKGRRQY